MRLYWLLGLLFTACTNTTSTDDGGIPFQLPDLTGYDGPAHPHHDGATNNPMGDGGCLALMLDGGTGDGGMCLPTDPDGPMIAFTAPAAGSIASGGTLVGTVSVSLQPNEQIDHIDFFAVGLPVPHVTMALVPQMPNTYSGSLDLSGVASGDLLLAATAFDLAGKKGSTTVAVTRDAGPTIKPYDPKPPPKTYRGMAPIFFSVVNPLGGAAFDIKGTPTATVQKVQFPLNVVPGQSPPTWQGMIDFHDPQFGQGLSGDQVLTITATNNSNTTATANLPFTVDEEGPIITFLKPAPGAFVGGVIDIQVQIDDISNVDDASVSASFGGANACPNMMQCSVALTRMPPNNGMQSDIFAGTFDTRQLPASFVLPLFTVQASDLLGNQAQQSEEIIIDNVAPAIDLDPPNDFRVWKYSSNIRECSQPFDPVGADAANDGDVVGQLIWLRARAEDRGNLATGQTVKFISTIDPATVEVWVIKASDAPLIVDSDGDGICDEINPALVPGMAITMSGQAVQVAMAPIGVAGSPDFESKPLTDPPVPFLNCQAIGEAGAQPPMTRCNIGADSPTYDLGYTDNGMEPAIYTIPPIAAGITCQGLQFDSLNGVPDGPICVAVQAKDKVGNRNVSRPLRLCLDKNGVGLCDSQLYQQHNSSNVQASGHANLPDCTGTFSMSKPDATKPCRPLVKYNTGFTEPAYSPNTPAYKM
jgi:hypothetical protein